MEFSVHLQGFHDFSPHRSASGTATIESRDIPPERVGLEGSYDHAGLSKRVMRLLSDHFGCFVAESLRISQRGQVVVIFSRAGVPKDLINPMVDLILHLEGANSVEINGIRHLRRSYVLHSMR
jgi:hypothetical protein